MLEPFPGSVVSGDGGDQAQRRNRQQRAQAADQAAPAIPPWRARQGVPRRSVSRFGQYVHDVRANQSRTDRHETQPSEDELQDEGKRHVETANLRGFPTEPNVLQIVSDRRAHPTAFPLLRTLAIQRSRKQSKALPSLHFRHAAVLDDGVEGKASPSYQSGDDGQLTRGIPAVSRAGGEFSRPQSPPICDLRMAGGFQPLSGVCRLGRRS